MEGISHLKESQKMLLLKNKRLLERRREKGETMGK